MRTALGLAALAAAMAAVAGGASPAVAIAPAPSAEAPIVVGIDQGGGPYLTAYDVRGGWRAGFLAYMDFTMGGVNVAAGDVDGDKVADLVSVPGQGGRGEVRTFDGSGKPKALTAFTTASGCGTRIAAGDVNGDKKADLVTGFEQCNPDIQVFDGATGNRIAYFATLRGGRGTHGIRVAAGDVTGDGKAEIIAANGPSEPATVKIYPGLPSTGAPAPLREFDAFGPTVTSGLEVASADVNRDGKDDVIVGAETPDDPQIKVFDGSSGVLRSSFSPFGLVSAGTLRVAAGDMDGDGRLEIVASATVNYTPTVRIFTAEGTQLTELQAPMYNSRSLAVGDLDGDGRAEIAMSAGPGYDSSIVVLDAAGTTIESWFQAYGYSFTNGVRVAMGDLDGNGTLEYVTGQGPGGTSNLRVLDAEGNVLHSLQPFGEGWQGLYVASGDVDGDARADVVAGAGGWSEPRVKIYDGRGEERASFPAFDEGFQGGVRVATGDLDGDGKAEVLAGTGPSGPPVVRVFDATGQRKASFFAFDPSYTGGIYVAAGDLDGDGRGEIVVGAGSTGEVRVFDASGVRRTSFTAYAPASDYSGGVRVAAGDVDGDGKAEIVTGPGSVRPVDVEIFRGDGTQIGSFRANQEFQGGIYVAVPAPLGPHLVNAGAAPVRGTEGRRLRLVATFSDPRGGATPDEFGARITWGDDGESLGVVQARGSGQYTISATHTYLQYGRYRVTVRIADSRLRAASAMTTAVVRDAPLSARGRVVRTKGRVFRGVVATVRDRDRGGVATDLRTVVRWGDGTSSRASAQYAAADVTLIGQLGRFRVSGQHRYGKAGSYRVLVSVRSAGGSRATAKTLIRVTR